MSRPLIPALALMVAKLWRPGLHPGDPDRPRGDGWRWARKRVTVVGDAGSKANVPCWLLTRPGCRPQVILLDRKRSAWHRSRS